MDFVTDRQTQLEVDFYIQCLWAKCPPANWISVTGSLEERLNQVLDMINQLSDTNQPVLEEGKKVTVTIPDAMYVSEQNDDRKRKGRKKYLPPPDFNPYKVFYDAGSTGLISQLSEMENDELKGILNRFTSTPYREYGSLSNRNLLINMIVVGIKNVATLGAEFGDYVLPN